MVSDDADRVPEGDSDPSLSGAVREEFARAMLPEGRDFAGPVRGSIVVTTAERDDAVRGVALDDEGRLLASSIVVDLDEAL